MDCPYIPDLSYSEFGKRLLTKLDGKRYPLGGSVELTFRCNLRCQHCYVAYEHNGVPERQELTTPEFHNLFDQLADQGCLSLLLTGGEPLVRRDFAEIYRYAKRNGFLLTLFTNGTLLSPEIADMLAEWRPLNIEITLYGYTQATYERVTGVSGSHARCLRGIELLLERGLPLKLKTMVMTLNQHELDEMRTFADSLGVEFRYDPMLNAGLEGASKPKGLRLPPEKVVALDIVDDERLKSWHEFLDRYGNTPFNPSTLYQCGAGFRSFHIDPYGELSLCLIARTPSYDLRRGSFEAGWEDFLQRARNQPATGEFACNQCDLRILCGQCPGWSLLETGNPQQSVEYLCRVAQQRVENFELQYKEGWWKVNKYQVNIESGSR